MKAQQLFSEMEARTRATEWEDRLLRANVLTVKKAHYLPYREANSIAEFVLISFGNTPNEDLKEIDLIDFSEKIGSHLQQLSICFDVLVRDVCTKARHAGLNENGLKRKLEETLLKGLEASIK